jgi:uncharacterized protein Smg (DUF494 family)
MEINYKKVIQDLLQYLYELVIGQGELLEQLVFNDYKEKDLIDLGFEIDEIINAVQTIKSEGE